MNKNRLELFSDGVLAIAITIMVLELRVPAGSAWADVATLAPALCTYLLSFIYIGIYWVNHFRLLEPVLRIDGAVLWANLHLLFWLSLIPFLTAWAGEHPLMPAPMVLYGVILLMCSVAFELLACALLAIDSGAERLALALAGRRRRLVSIGLYALAATLSLWLAAAGALVYVAVALWWLLPERGIRAA
jgi:uncharacterized membrane protein